MESERPDDLLTTETVGTYLRERGLVAEIESLRAVELTGGIANVVIAVSSNQFRAVVKQALPRFRTESPWFVKTGRSTTEARALTVAGELEPGSVPRVLDSDANRSVLVIERAPDDWPSYKQMLLAGNADALVAARCGVILGSWHRKTWDDKRIAAIFDDLEAFDQQRIDPYYRTVAVAHPRLRGLIEGYAERMAANRKALVHGDFSPKNVLAGSERVWILDWEVAHFGDPAFDVAFMVNHLMLKTIHRPSSADGYRKCADAFWGAYLRNAVSAEAAPADYVFGQLACLMLARVDGKSPAEYLSEPERKLARALGTSFLIDPPESVPAAWARLEDSAKHDSA